MTEPNRLPPIWVPTHGDGLSTCAEFECETTDGCYLREADAVSDGAHTAKYEPAVPRCKTCESWNTNTVVLHQAADERLCAILRRLKTEDEYCSDHSNVKR